MLFFCCDFCDVNSKVHCYTLFSRLIVLLLFSIKFDRKRCIRKIVNNWIEMSKNRTESRALVCNNIRRMNGKRALRVYRLGCLCCCLFVCLVVV